MSRQLFAGWGRAAPSAASLHRIAGRDHAERVVADLAASGGNVIARGLGRSYGDAAQCSGGNVLDCTSLDSVDLDPASGIARVGAGVSIAHLLSRCLPFGWCVDVMPGTAQVTVGGAVAADVHGKNHHADGAFSRSLRSIELVGTGGVRRVGPGESESPELYWATIGGMGLTGVVTEVTLQLRRVETSFVEVETARTPDLDGCMALLLEHATRHRHSVAWVDGLASGRSFGRSVVTSGDHARPDALPPRARRHPLAYAPASRLAVPLTPPFGVVRREVVRPFNDLWYAKAPRHRAGEIQTLATFFHPLDALGSWNRLYGPSGFTQYQLVTPFSRPDVVARVIETLARARLVPSLVVLKTFGDGDGAPLSFPTAGWTLALDLPLGAPDLAPTLDGLDGLVAAAGGRVYLAKDGRLRPELVATMYPRLAEWEAARDEADPGHVFSSDLWRRLAPPSRG